MTGHQDGPECLEAAENPGRGVGVTWHGPEHFSAKQTCGLQRDGPGLPGQAR